MQNGLEKVWIYLENGTYLEAKSFGAKGTSVGEIVFNTSLLVASDILIFSFFKHSFSAFGLIP